MKILIKITAAVAVIIGLLAAITGTRVLLGAFVPDYKFYTTLVVYNVLAGLISIVAGILIWKQKIFKALIVSFVILFSHLTVWVLIKTVFACMISQHSVNAMTFRVIIWIIISVVLWFYAKRQKNL